MLQSRYYSGIRRGALSKTRITSIPNDFEGARSAIQTYRFTTTKPIRPNDALNWISNNHNPKCADVGVKCSLENTVSLDLVMVDSYMPLGRSVETVLTAHDVRHIARLVLRMCCSLSTTLKTNQQTTADILLTL
jgi:hypothetical protein